MDCYQRLVLDHKGQINYDYMGYGEYEFGATHNARFVLARLFRDTQLAAGTVTLQDARMGHSCPVAVFSSAAVLWNLRHGVLRVDNKGPLGIRTPKVIGWMGCAHTTPILVLRDQAHIPQADTFLNSVIQYWAENPGEEPVA